MVAGSDQRDNDAEGQRMGHDHGEGGRIAAVHSNQSGRQGKMIGTRGSCGTKHSVWVTGKNFLESYAGRGLGTAGRSYPESCRFWQTC
jgi:hypothetical protein